MEKPKDANVTKDAGEQNNPPQSKISRRSLLKGAAAIAAVGAVALVAGPFVTRNVFSSSGELYIYAWSDYITQDMLDRFTKETGIKVNAAVYGSNDEVLNKLRAAGGKGFDLVFPSVTYTPLYHKHNLLQPIDEKKVHVDNVMSSKWEAAEKLGAIHHRKRYALPFNWGTEAITFNTEERDYKYGELSFATPWEPENEEKVTVRAHSALIGIGLHLDHVGKVPSNKMLDTYETPEKMRKVYDEIIKFAVEHKRWIRRFWSNAQETELAFLKDGCVIGQTWDGPAFRLRNQTNGKITYLAPKEGALTWLDTMAIPSGAKNIEQAYAFINWYYTPEIGALFANQTGYNTVVEGAAKYLEPETKENFEAAYPGDALENLWWYPPSPPWFPAIRNEYRDRFLAT